VQIEKLIKKYGGSEYTYHNTAEGGVIIMFRMDGILIRRELPLPTGEEKEYTHHSRGRRTEASRIELLGQAHRQRWRAFHLIIQAILEGHELGITDRRREFFGDTVLPGETANRTVFTVVGPQIEEQRQLLLTGSKK